MRTTLLPLFVACLLLTTAYGPGPLAQSETTAIDIDQLRLELQEFHSTWIIAATSRDVALAASMYADDAVAMPPNSPRVVGRAAIEKGLTELFESVTYEDIQLSLDHVSVSESGELAYAVSGYRDRFTMDGKSMTETGNHFAVFRKVNGEWKMAAEMWVSDHPPPE